MECPRCSAVLVTKTHRGIEVDYCTSYKGMWLDADELDELEDKAFDQDELKGSLMLGDKIVEHHCPHCDTPLRRFRYRFSNVYLEYCEHEHGFWLDEGEEEQIIEWMKQREKDMKNKAKAEANWGKTLSQLKSKSFMSKLKDLFK